MPSKKLHFAILIVRSVLWHGNAVYALTPAERVARLIDPVKLSTLAVRGANPRMQKYVTKL